MPAFFKIVIAQHTYHGDAARPQLFSEYVRFGFVAGVREIAAKEKNIRRLRNFLKELNPLSLVGLPNVNVANCCDPDFFFLTHPRPF
jgi:hypothetical protein